jgi:hypothetical protein
MEVLLAALFRASIEQWLLNAGHKRNPKLSAAKLERQAKADAATAITKLVGSVHNAVQVPPRPLPPPVLPPLAPPHPGRALPPA